ncbi:GNAT family N-acetyltransferase [Mucilaginibacter robiniae]|uniref:GNAT family N-acetyltransferase n=1 Tax=Mucilaginibacter robiniae TaxID=2728022 RepID=A0A7L5E5N6_9SPHI|nr:GNAT family N-acetyltransferase [Mucilaginibacter robiniae]QJD97938.1 GNAT family N-acetyltransferase [Mucilaginibacter robiniae]
MIITEVTDRVTKIKFLDTARYIYQQYLHDTNWICPLDNDIENVFDPKKNNFFQFGTATRWLLTSDSGQPLGRIGAFINEKKAYQNDQPTGGVGFFECVQDQQAANKLFDTARQWLQQHGMKAMDGPINFGENDMFWGLLVEGFMPQSYGMNYHPSYYKNLFEQYGFETMYEQITNHIDAHKPFPERFTKIANWVIQKPGYEFKHLEPAQIEDFAADFMEIYNDAWQDFDKFVPIQKQTILKSFQQMKAIMDKNLIWFAYVNQEPAAFIVVLPDANQMIKTLNGKLNLIGKLKFLYHKWKGVNRMRAVVMGTKNKYQKHGLESAMFIKIKEYVLPLKQYDEMELSWVGDFNDRMLALHQATGATFGKKHATMRYIFK